EQVVLGVVDHHQAAGAERGDLTAQLAADGAAGAGHHDGAAVEVPGDLREVDLHGGPSQDVLHTDLAVAADGDVAGDELREARQRGAAHPRPPARLGDVAAHHAGRGRHGDDDLVHLVLAVEAREVRPGSAGLDAHHAHAALAGVVVDEADRVVPQGP